MLEKGRILPLKILVKEPPKIEKKTASGIVIPETVKSNPTIMGEVVLTGDSTPNMKMVVEKNDKVLFSPHAFVKVNIEEQEYLLLDQANVLYIWK